MSYNVRILYLFGSVWRNMWKYMGIYGKSWNICNLGSIEKTTEFFYHTHNKIQKVKQKNWYKRVRCHATLCYLEYQTKRLVHHQTVNHQVASYRQQRPLLKNTRLSGSSMQNMKFSKRKCPINEADVVSCFRSIAGLTKIWEADTGSAMLAWFGNGMGNRVPHVKHHG